MYLMKTKFPLLVLVCFLYMGCEMEPPVAVISITDNFGSNPTIILAGITRLRLIGTQSQSGGDLNYNWKILSRPSLSICEIEGANESVAIFLPDFVGEYKIELEVTDSKNQKSFATIILDVKGCNKSPINLSITYKCGMFNLATKDEFEVKAINGCPPYRFTLESGYNAWIDGYNPKFQPIYEIVDSSKLKLQMPKDNVWGYRIIVVDSRGETNNIKLNEHYCKNCRIIIDESYKKIIDFEFDNFPNGIDLIDGRVAVNSIDSSRIYLKNGAINLYSGSSYSSLVYDLSKVNIDSYKEIVVRIDFGEFYLPCLTSNTQNSLVLASDFSISFLGFELFLGKDSVCPLKEPFEQSQLTFGTRKAIDFEWEYCYLNTNWDKKDLFVTKVNSQNKSTITFSSNAKVIPGQPYQAINTEIKRLEIYGKN